jgi:hypothetical protein
LFMEEAVCRNPKIGLAWPLDPFADRPIHPYALEASGKVNASIWTGATDTRRRMGRKASGDGETTGQELYRFAEVQLFDSPGSIEHRDYGRRNAV